MLYSTNIATSAAPLQSRWLPLWFEVAYQVTRHLVGRTSPRTPKPSSKLHRASKPCAPPEGTRGQSQSLSRAAQGLTGRRSASGQISLHLHARWVQITPLGPRDTKLRDVDVRKMSEIQHALGSNQIPRRGTYSTLRYLLSSTTAEPLQLPLRSARWRLGCGLPVRGRQAVLHLRFVRRTPGGAANSRAVDNARGRHGRR